MMKTILSIFCLCVPILLSAQKQIKVKKGKVYNGEQVIAEYDGKGGAFRSGSYKLTAPGDTSTLMSFKEINYEANNPMYPPAYNLYEIEFSSHPDRKFYYLPQPRVFKILARIDTLWDTRKLGNDLIECFFNDTTDLLVKDKAVAKSTVESVMAKLGFDYESMLKDRKAAEEAIGTLLKTEISRDKTKPIQLTEVQDAGKYGSTFNIFQDGKLIGQLSKFVGNRVDYEIWKAAPNGTVIAGKPMAFLPVAQILNATTSMDKLYDLTDVISKKKIRFTTVNITAAEYDIINLLIKNGNL